MSKFTKWVRQIIASHYVVKNSRKSKRKRSSKLDTKTFSHKSHVKYVIFIHKYLECNVQNEQLKNSKNTECKHITRYK